MLQNQQTRYGAISKILPNLGVQGNAYFVAPAGSNYIGDLLNEFPVDLNGVVRTFTTVTAALAAAVADRGDVIYIAPGEYDENVTVSKNKVSLVGIGPRDSVRITALTNGTAITISGVQDVEIKNINAEGRGTGGAIKATGQIRRVTISGCKLHGGATAVLVNAGASGQVVDFTLEDNAIGLVTTGVSNSVGAGDPTHRLVIKNNRFFAITTDVIVSAGSAINTLVYGNVVANDGDTEPTRFVKLDGSGDSGIVANNFFATATNANTKFVLDADVMWVSNSTEAGVSTARPA